MEGKGGVMENKGFSEYIGEGGFGDEAKVTIEFRTEFPGIGGMIVTYEGAVTALRKEYNCIPKAGHKMFLRHAIIKKLEDYFHRKEVYRFPHVPRPLGSISITGKKPYEAYIYEWAFGSDGFPWGYMDPEKGYVPVILRDWDKFVGAFLSAGIDLGSDCTTPEPERTSQNIIHQLYKYTDLWSDSGLNFLWQRIDFGERSIRIDYDKLSRFLQEKEKDLKRVLRVERHDMIRLSYEYLTKGKEVMDRLDMGRLDSLVGDYRLSSLRHFISRNFGRDESVIVSMGSRTESLV